MSQRLPLIMFLVGLFAGDLTFRLTEYETFQVALLVSCALAAVLFAVSGLHELVHDAAFPLVGGYAASCVIKWIFATMLA
jgi:hypothetical protein